ncbi:membrane hypothetical protein [Verrucomicrobia bacterium]|nr:membrane hypothetical protein [Verrucomicrobiota bacterium]
MIRLNGSSSSGAAPEETSAAADPGRGGTEPGLVQQNAPQVFRLGYRPGLDGLRGLSILGVLLTHTELVNNRAGLIGVDVFFVLSGFLITCLLVEEWDRFHSISLRRFYLRRVLRLLPALVVMLGVVAAYHWMFKPRTAAQAVTVDALVALFYSANWAQVIQYHTPNVLGHAWSLSIEEQFYLIWPLVLIFLLRRTASRKSMLSWVLLAACLPLVTRVLLLTTIVDPTAYRILYGTDTRGDALLLGCALGVAFNSGLAMQARPVMAASKWMAWIALLGLVCLTFYQTGRLDLGLCVILFLIPALATVVLTQVVLYETGTPNRSSRNRGWCMWGKSLTACICGTIRSSSRSNPTIGPPVRNWRLNWL